MKLIPLITLLGYTSLIGLTACNGSSVSVDDTETQITKVPDLNPSELSFTALRPSNNNEFLTYLKNGVYINASSQYYKNYAPEMVADAASDNASGGFSQTITQEAGVDEADRVKYDGNIFYIAANRYSNFVFSDDLNPATENQTVANSHIRVMQREADKSLTELSKIELGSSETNSSIKGLYLADNKLSVLSEQYNYYQYIDLAIDVWRRQQQRFNFSLFDVTTPSIPSSQVSYEIEGYMISSRRIDNKLFIISSFSPNVDNLVFAQTQDEELENYKKVLSLQESDLMPSYTNQDGETKLLVSSDNCYLPADASDKDGYDAIVTLTSINLDNPAEVNSVCVNSHIQGIYASDSSIYMYGSDYNQKSFIHQFNVSSQDIDYIASTELTGHFGWNQTNLRFSEYNGYLRVVTSLRNNNENDRLEHKLHILKANTATKNLDLIANLPNETETDPIGKPNEDIYAVRYYGDKAYIVTFERIDPLYVIDLSDETAPKIVGELEIPGFSSYLHPISDKLIFAIGQEIDQNRFLREPTPDNISIAPPTQEGAKVVLFDVSDPQNPTEIGKKIFPNGYTPAEYNYHALTYLKISDDEHRFALPIQTWGVTQTADTGVWRETTELALFEVKTQDSSTALNHKSSVQPALDGNAYIGSYEDRAILHKDDSLSLDSIFYLHGNQFWHATWDDPSVTNGPY
ncbi:beta-propeller domain-containing protein [Catenovulum maritimum]|uniref:Beta-propeller domain-containing protein n=1 Tax=Catenovulum maritimum TaxID=1513271 RepID=A0A0J8GUA6_9ALTE|nr:beta-propeller domain-containing protein [Catenovulum maritimum]KMT64894.1 hypothetical protein XM47_11835 [Catenovulum maritimum]